MSNTPIKNIFARQILDSRGNPTVEVTVEAGSGRGTFGVPSGASTGSAEALELRDGGKDYGGLGVLKAVANVNAVIAKNIRGMNVFDQEAVDEAMIGMDGTPNKKKLGANAILGVSGAVVKAAAAAKKIPIYKYVGSLAKKKKLKLPKPMFNVINGGQHGDTNLDVQEFMLVPKFDSMAENVRVASEIFHFLEKVLKGRRLNTNLGNEGGFSPHVESNRQALDFIAEAAKEAGFALGKDISIATDIAASGLFKAHDSQYVLSADHTSLSAERLVSLLKEWAEKYSIISIEDGLAEEDWEGWLMMQSRLGDKLMLVGDDLFATRADRLKKGIDMGVANAIIIKPNQVGTITETLATAALAQKNNYKIVASHRSGETTDDFIADFAVGIGAEYIKAGSVARGERVAKYNRLMQIEEELKN
ncbi:MAG: phosphopyruvate hydratase [Candidatus Doudnabacteria bacterium]